MYHFVKYNNIWYLKVETKQDIMDHYHIILRREFEEGLKDRVSSTHFCKNGDVYIEHPVTAWAKVIETYMVVWNLSWVMAAHKLETETINGRLQLFDRGCTIYLNDGLTYFSPKDNVEYEDECWKDSLEYPEPDTYTVNDIRYIQWKDGSHWYAKIGKYDVVDENGNQKWDKYNDAINAAYSFLKTLNKND
jgi:hypothetical protein